MEAIVLLLFGWLTVAATAAMSLIVVLVDLAVFVVATITQLVLLPLQRGKAAELPTEENESDTATEPLETLIGQRTGNRSRLAGRVSAVSAVVLAVMMGGGLIAGTVAFEPTTRWLIRGVADRSGIEIDFTQATGSLLSGRIDLGDVTLRRESHPRDNFDIEIDRLLVDLDIWTVLSSTVEFETVRFEGLSGTYTQSPEAPPAPGRLQQPMGSAFSIEQPEFRARNVHIEDARLDLRISRRGSTYRGELAVEEFNIEELSARTWLIDILIRSRGSGAIADSTFDIDTIETAQGRRSRWDFRRLPVALLASQYGGPFVAFRDGRADILVVDEWELGERPRVDSHWKIVFENIEVELPAEIPEPLKLALSPAIDHLREKSDRLPIEFHIKIDPETLGLFANEQTTELSELVRDAAYDAIAKAAGINTEKVRQTADEIFDAIRDGLDRLRNR
ncbi:hypothetical protein [Stratiformator vulcanicus]|uniref:Uncharacterized protein n=1 Tax=Stratiformator vulcanicus TaxID=2527980 RepID=A0A517QVR5_9PLAN|nr:hypothetical protein [Stratiformator vulcanicus]QDT35745.1 hypothetical protein Pan189_00980 [Stratiformator vulcanicus]